VPRNATLSAVPPPPNPRVVEQLHQWRDDLINLTKTNRLLYFRPNRTSTIEILEPGPVEVFDRLLEPRHGGWGFFVPPDAVTEEAPAPRLVRARRTSELQTDKTDGQSLNNGLRALKRRAEAAFMEAGLSVLYLAVGMVRWKIEDEDGEIQSPILLLPVILQQESPREPVRLLRGEDDPSINPALTVKWKNEFGIELPTIEDVEDISIPALLEAVRRAFAGRHGWTAEPRVILSTFSFHKEAMYRDLQENEQLIAAHPAIVALAEGPTTKQTFDFVEVSDDELDDAVPAEQMASILDADASQRKCIHAARTGQSFVMDGPPGTGKSQTIANIIAELMVAGKTTLFVSEKAAALEVVYARLKAAGLSEYLLELHSHKATRREVAQELGRALIAHPRPRSPLSDNDIASLVARRHELSRYVAAVNEVRAPLGMSVFEAVGRVAKLQSLPAAPWPPVFKHLDGQLLESLTTAAAALARVWGPVERPDSFLWRDINISEYVLTLRRDIEDQLAAAERALLRLAVEVKAIAGALGVQWSEGELDAERLAALLGHLQNRPLIPAHWLSSPDVSTVNARLDEAERLAANIAREKGHFTQVGITNPRELPVPSAARLSALAEQLKALLGQPPVPDPDAVGLGELAGFLGNGHESLMKIEVQAQEIAAAFNLPEGPMSLDRAAEIAELGLMIGLQERPEADWLNPRLLQSLLEAATVLAALAQDFRSKRKVLEETFTERVLTLDLDGLSLRFRQVHKGPFKVFSSAYRTDRKALAGCTQAGKVTRGALAQLEEANAWKKLTAQLLTAEQRHGPLLGQAYQRDETNFEVLMSVVETARRAVAIAGAQLDPAALARQISRNGSPDLQVHNWALQVRDQVVAWRQAAERMLGPAITGRLAGMPLSQARRLCRELSPVTTEIGEILANISALYGKETHLQEAAQWSTWRLAIGEADSKFAADLEANAGLIGPAYRAADTDFAAIRRAVGWSERLLHLTEGTVLPGVAHRLLETTLDATALQSLVVAWRNAREVILAHFVPARGREVQAELSGTFANSQTYLRRLVQTASDIEEWTAHVKLRARLKDAGLESVSAFCVDRRVPASQVSGIFARATLERWVDQVTSTDTRLKELRPTERDEFVAEFRELDRRLIGASAARIIAECNSRRPRPGIGQAAIIEREANKTRRHMPVKKLLQDAGAVARALKPCFMMSPLSVSQFLDSSTHFDAVIFDEASQVKPSDAINCIYRGAQLIVAGDNKQLPPTSFWEAATTDDSDEYVEDQLEDFQSVLELCKGSGAYRSLSLMWHYRSQHEALITYSNHSFYDGRLITFPGAVQSAADLGVHLLHVPGVYRRSAQRDNPVEAAAAADRVFFHAAKHPELSLGVVTFSEAQATAIEGEIDRRRLQRSDLDAYFKPDRLRGVFVKSLESVQGDERDIMIFSLGYGPDEFGRFTLNFGPLNQRGGHRRLNVAITRARRRVEVVSSVRASNFVGQIQEGGGVWHLRRYLDFLERGVPVLGLPVETERKADSDLEEEITRVIESWGYEVVPQVGTAHYRVDLGVRKRDDNSRFILGVECDGAMYHASRVARDRDRLRQQVLEGLGWHLYRVWAPAWFRDRQREEVRLHAALDAAASQAPPSDDSAFRPGPQPLIEDPPSDILELVAGDQPTWTVPYEVAEPTPPRRGTEMHLPEAARDLQRMIEEVLRVEGPVSEAVVIRRVCEAWGVGRAGQRIQSAFDDAFNHMRRAGILVREANFIRLRNQEVTAVRYPTGNSRSGRRADEVPPAELELALSKLAAEALGVHEDDLTDAVAQIFGWRRRGVDIRSVLSKAVQRLVADGRLRRAGETLEWTGSPPIRDEPRYVEARPLPQVKPAPAPVWQPEVAGSVSQEDEPDVIPPNVAKYITADGFEALRRQGRTGLDELTVIPARASHDRVRLGCRVTFAENGGGEETFRIVGPLEAAVRDGKLNVLSQVGGALWGHRVGDVVDLSVPGFEARKLHITAITP